MASYQHSRDIPAIKGTSNLSENLAFGEISPAQCWHAAQRALAEGKPGAEVFLKELVWREFAYHLTHHTPHILSENWRPEWDAFPWNHDEAHPHVMAWKQGRTGIRFVDAAMREMYVTGRMHNRGRMIAASYLTKHLLMDWRIGQRWFEQCLIVWDPASNAMGWQWSAGSGPDATPYFRVFNPETQLDKFDPDRVYVSRWIAEGMSRSRTRSAVLFRGHPKILEAVAFRSLSGSDCRCGSGASAGRLPPTRPETSSPARIGSSSCRRIERQLPRLSLEMVTARQHAFFEVLATSQGDR